MQALKNNSKKLLTLIVVLTVVLIGLLINMSRDNVRNAVSETALKELHQTGAQMQIILDDTLEEGKEELTFLANYIVKNNVPFHEIGAFLRTQSQIEGFKSIYSIDLNGNGVSLDDLKRDFSENEAFLNAIDNAFYVPFPVISTENNEIEFEICVPIIKDGVVLSALYAEIQLFDFFDIVMNNIGTSGDVYIVDHDLNIIFSSNETYHESSVFSDGDINEMGLENIALAQTDIVYANNGGFNYDYYGIPKVVVFYPIENTSWTVAINAEADVLTSTLTEAVDILETVESIIYWMIIALVTYISIFNFFNNKRVTKVAYYDPLTELSNVAKLKLDVTTALQSKNRTDYTILIFDIENFKAINQMFGYEVGDRVLKTIKSFSDSLGEPSLISARIASDKFAMFAHREFLGNLDSIIETVSIHFDERVPELIDYAATFKIGRYEIEPGETDFDDIMAKVNMAHARAKISKGEIICDYDDTFKKKVIYEAEIMNKMSTALDNEEFKVYLQPKFNSNNSTLVGAEALVRWIEPDGKMIFPNDFIPLFERNGFIVELDKYVLEIVCKTIRRWIDSGMGQLTVSVNCSRLNLQNPFYVDGLIAIADKYAVPHSCIEIELTESATIDSESAIESLFIALRKNGFKISIDDFGAGYSSLGMLKNLHVDTLKMDRSFFVGGKNARRDDLLIDSIVKMSHNLGMYVVAEGIETQEQVDLLKTMNCDAIQGYVFSKPMPISEFEEEFCDIMSQIAEEGTNSTTMILNINDTKFVSSFVPCGIIIAEMDEYFTILEANEGFFDLVGYTKEEIKKIFNNRAFQMIHPEDSFTTANSLIDHYTIIPTGAYDVICRIVHKYEEYRTVQINARISVNARGKERWYMVLTDVSDKKNSNATLRIEKDFNSNIALLLDSAFFEYDIKNDILHFTANFAEKFNIPSIINNFSTSELIKKYLPMYSELLLNRSMPESDTGIFSIDLPNGPTINYTYSYKTIYNYSQNNNIIVGKLVEVENNTP